MQKKQYIYDYPEQRKLSEDLKFGDQKIIADKTGYSEVMIALICQGKRRMPERIKKLIELIVLVNNKKDRIIKEMQIE